MFRKMLEEKLMEEKREEEEKKRREEAGRRRKKSESSSDESLSLGDLGLLPVLAILKHLMDDSDDDDDDEPAKKVHNVTSMLPNGKGSSIIASTTIHAQSPCSHPLRNHHKLGGFLAIYERTYTRYGTSDQLNIRILV